MAANSKSTQKQGAASAASRQLGQLKQRVKELTLRLEREVKDRKLAARLVAEATKGREQFARQAKALREQGQKLALELKSALGDAGKRKQALKDAQSKIGELKAELVRKTADLRIKSKELKKLTEETAHRAAAIMRGEGEPGGRARPG